MTGDRWFVLGGKRTKKKAEIQKKYIKRVAKGKRKRKKKKKE